MAENNRRTAAGSCEHRFGPPHVYVATHGPMEGTWVLRECEDCRTFSLRSREDPAGSITAVLAALAAKGCDPRVSA